MTDQEKLRLRSLVARFRLTAIIGMVIVIGLVSALAIASGRRAAKAANPYETAGMWIVAGGAAVYAVLGGKFLAEVLTGKRVFRWDADGNERECEREVTKK